MPEINYLAVIVATIAQFIFSAIWYMPLFGKVWGEMHGFDKIAPEKQKQMQGEMWKLLIPQFIFTLITTIVFAIIIGLVQSDWSIYWLAALFWVGFTLPTQAAVLMFGGSPEGWIIKKLTISTICSLICMEIIALVFTLMS